MHENPIPNRLESLDVLRGLDLFCLVALHPLLMALAQVCDQPMLHNMLYQFDHEVWEGFRFWDLIMPLFLFMTGITIPFSLDRKIGTSYVPVYKHVFRRVLILWFLGMVIQGNLLAFDGHYLRIFSNTLQAIAIGYLLASILYFHFSIRVLIAVSVVLMVVYSLPFLLSGNYTPQDNFAMRVDKHILGSFMDGVYWDEQGSWHFSAAYDYTWIWSSLNFAVTVLMGVFAGKIIKNTYKTNPLSVFKSLMYIGLSLLILGWLLGFYQPIIKRIWTSSFTMFSGGICFMLMALFFYIIDLKNYKKQFSWLKIFGMNSIVAYFLGTFINFRPLIHQLTYGLENIFPDYSALILSGGNVLIIVLILHVLFKNRVFVKI